MSEGDRGADANGIGTPDFAPRDFHCGRLHVPTGTWQAPEKGMLGISHYIGVRLVLGVVDACGHAGGVGLGARGL